MTSRHFMVVTLSVYLILLHFWMSLFQGDHAGIAASIILSYLQTFYISSYWQQSNLTPQHLQSHPPQLCSHLVNCLGILISKQIQLVQNYRSNLFVVVIKVIIIGYYLLQGLQCTHTTFIVAVFDLIVTKQY